PLGDRRAVVQVEIQQLAGDVGLPSDDLGLPIGADAVAAPDRLTHHQLVRAGPLGEDRADEVRVLVLPRLDVDVQDLADLLLGERHVSGSSTMAATGRGGLYGCLGASSTSASSRGSRRQARPRSTPARLADSSRTQVQRPQLTSMSLA